MKTRRDFLKLLGKVAVVVGVGTCVPGQLLAKALPRENEEYIDLMNENAARVKEMIRKDVFNTFAQPHPPQHKHDYTLSELPSHTHGLTQTHMIHEWEMPSHR